MPSTSKESNPTHLPLANSSLRFQGTFLHYANPSSKLEVTLHLSISTESDEKNRDKANNVMAEHPLKRTYLNHKELQALVGANANDIVVIAEFFKAFNIKTVKKNLLARTVNLVGYVADFNKAFQTDIGVYQGFNNTVFMAYAGTLNLPAELHGLVQNVSGITSPAKIEHRIPTKAVAQDTASSTTGYTAQQLATAYNFPKNLQGKGQCIGIVELGGAYKKSDITAYFKMMKLPVPQIIEVGTPINTTNTLDNSEVTLDVEVVGTIAPKAKLVIYYGNTILDAMKLIIQDKKNKPDVVSISWAASEYNYNNYQISELNNVFHEAALLGITVIAASGDHGAMNGKGFPNVSIPSSHPLVTGCGGTNVTLNPDDSIASEVVWNQNNGQIGSGGGFSKLFPLPGYQQMAVSCYPYYKGSTRGVPDLAANADSTHGYIVIFNGMKMPIGGTSASTPLIAGLFALMNESLGSRLGFVNTWLYQFANRGFHQITQGNNGYYPAAGFWNPATGLGSPNGEQLLELFKAEQ